MEGVENNTLFGRLVTENGSVGRGLTDHFGFGEMEIIR